MHNSRKFRRKSWLAFTAAVTSIAAIVVILLAGESMGVWLNVTLLTIFMGATIALFVLGGIRAYEARSFAKFERCEGVIARWIVDPITWCERQALRRTRAGGCRR